VLRGELTRWLNVCRVVDPQDLKPYNRAGVVEIVSHGAAIDDTALVNGRRLAALHVRGGDLKIDTYPDGFSNCRLRA